MADNHGSDTTSCIRHRANTGYFILYQDYRDISASVERGKHEHKVAAFLRVLEVKTNKKREYNDELIKTCQDYGRTIPKINLWIEMTYADMIKLSQGIFQRSSFQIADTISEKLGYSKSRLLNRPRNPNDTESSPEDYKEYILVQENVQAALDGKPLPFPVDSKEFVEYGKDTPCFFQQPPTEINSPPVEKNTSPLHTPLLKKTAPPVENNWINNKGNYENESKEKDKDISVQSSNDNAQKTEQPSLPSQEISSKQESLPSTPIAIVPPTKKESAPRKPQTPRRQYAKPAPPAYTLEENAILSAWNEQQICDEDEDSHAIHDLIASLTKKIQNSKGKAQISDIKRAYDKLAADDFWKDKITLKLFNDRFNALLKGLNTPLSGKPATNGSAHPPKPSMAEIAQQITPTPLIVQDASQPLPDAYKGRNGIEDCPLDSTPFNWFESSMGNLWRRSYYKNKEAQAAWDAQHALEQQQGEQPTV